jgi:hypothetical protein
MDLNKALRTAVHQAFTISGGVRQGPYSKIFVIFIPKLDNDDEKITKESADMLKSIGVKLMIVGLSSNVDQRYYRSISSQPASSYIVTGVEMLELIHFATSKAAVAICKGKKTNACDFLGNVF